MDWALMKATGPFAQGGRVPRPAIAAPGRDGASDWGMEITSLARPDGKVQGVTPLALAARHEQWSKASVQLLRLVQARSAAQLHLATAASTCERSENIASRAKRCTGYGLGACLVGCLVLLVIVNAVNDEAADSADESGSDTVTTGAGVTAYLMLTAALGLLCFTSRMHVRARQHRDHADRAAARVEELTRELDDQEAEVVTAEHALRVDYARSALDEARMPKELTTLITDYLEPPEDRAAPPEPIRSAGQSLEDSQDVP